MNALVVDKAPSAKACNVATVGKPTPEVAHYRRRIPDDVLQPAVYTPN